MSDSQQNPTLPRAPARWEKAFLRKLSKTGNVSEAARAAKIDRSTVYDHKNTDEEFARLWKNALEEAADGLEEEARRRAVDGVLEPVYQGGEKVGEVRKYSDGLLTLLLKAHKPETFRERVDMTTGGDKLPGPVIYLPEVQNEE